MKAMTALILMLLLFGCGTIRESTITETFPQTVPEESYSNIEYYPVYIYPTNEYADSIKQWTLINLCKGEMNSGQGNLESAVRFYVRRVKAQDDTIRTKNGLIKSLENKLILVVESNAKSKEHEIQGEMTVESSKKTPGQLWIFMHSFQFTIPIAVIFLLIGILLHAKTEVIKKII